MTPDPLPPPRLQTEPLDLDALLENTEDPHAGALVVFGGTVRNHHLGAAVTELDYSAYGPLAEKALAEIEAEATARHDILHCRLQHRLGRLAIGEVSVYVVVRAAHRGPAFEAARWAIDTLKQRVAIWKREHYADGREAFVEGTPLHREPDSERMR